MRVPAAIPALAILSGTAAACFVTVPSAWPAAACGAGFLAAGAAFRCRLAAAFLPAVALVFASGAWVLGARSFRDAEVPPLRAALAGLLPTPWPVPVEGRLRADASPGPNGVSLEIEASSVGPASPLSEPSTAGPASRVSMPGGIRLTVSGALALDRAKEWRAGRLVRLPASLREPARSLDPGVPDSRLDLARRGTVLLGSVKSALLVEVVRRGTWLEERAADLRAYARSALARHVGRWSSRSAAIVVAILIGDRVGLDDDVQQKLREAGTYHVIAISGGNIAILAALIVLLLRMARVPSRLGCWLAIASLAGYAGLVGGGASVVRATLMAAGYLAARQAGHRSPPLNALAVACGMILIASPLAVCDAGFALTFGATLGILIGASPHLPTRRWLRAPLALLAASVSAELALFPVSAFAFSRVTFAGLVLNFAAIPLMTLAQVSGMAVLPLAAVWPAAASLAGWAAHAGAEGLVRSAALVDVAPWLSWRLPPPHPAALACYYGAWCGWLWRRGVPRARRWRAACATIMAGSSIWILTEPVSLLFPGVAGRLRVTVLDVGHADAVLIQLPDRRSLLVDAAGSMAGGSFDIGGRVVAPALWALGTRRLDAFIITHGDPDHVGGAASVMRDFRPREVWEGIPVRRSAAMNQLQELAEKTGAAWRQRRAGEVEQFGEVTLRVWHPGEPDWERQKVRNDDSLVLELRYRDVSLVLPGDIGSAIERQIAASFPPARLRVLKVPHHGSASSSSAEFLAALRPSLAIISAGATTKVNEEVLDRYRAVGADVLRTNEDGAVTVTIEGQRVSFNTFTGRVLTLETTKNTKDTKKKPNEP